LTKGRRPRFDGGPPILLHSVVAFGASAVYFVANRVLPFLIDRALLPGILYGIAVHLALNFLAVPPSAIGRQPFVPRVFGAVLIVHMIVVGPSIALTVRHYAS
jgi:hypothetical protein